MSLLDSLMTWVIETWSGRLTALALIVTVVYYGAKEAAAEPPQYVVDREWFTTTSCDTDAKTGERDCTTSTTHRLISETGATCDVMRSTYYRMRQGQQHKCLQLFGWHGEVRYPAESGGTFAPLAQTAGGSW